MFSYTCVWLLLVTTVFEPFMDDSIKGGTIGNKVWAQILYMLCKISYFALVILSFFFMAKWWHPIPAMAIGALISGIVKAIPAVNTLMYFLCWIVTPVLITLTYLSLFGVI